MPSHVTFLLTPPVTPLVTTHAGFLLLHVLCQRERKGVTARRTRTNHGFLMRFHYRSSWSHLMPHRFSWTSWRLTLRRDHRRQDIERSDEGHEITREVERHEKKRKPGFAPPLGCMSAHVSTLSFLSCIGADMRRLGRGTMGQEIGKLGPTRRISWFLMASRHPKFLYSCWRFLFTIPLFPIDGEHVSKRKELPSIG